MQAQIIYLPIPPLDQSPSSIQSHRKYSRITPEIKQQFLKKILFQNINIKKAAKMLKINYSSAKSILSSHKRNTLQMIQNKTQNPGAMRVEYRDLSQGNGSKKGINELSCSVGGLLVGNHMISKPSYGNTNLIKQQVKKQKRETSVEDELSV